MKSVRDGLVETIGDVADDLQKSATDLANDKVDLLLIATQVKECSNRLIDLVDAMSAISRDALKQVLDGSPT